MKIVIRFTDDQEPQLRFDIVDSEIGISLEQQATLFQSFSQGDGSVNRKFDGTGLGLAISKRLTEMLGGKLTVESEPGCGSTFIAVIATGDIKNVELIQPKLWAESAHESDRAEPLRLDCHVLIVDDRRDVRFLSSTVLKEAGATISEAEDGEVAIQKFQEQRDGKRASFNLILLDMQMPRVDGYQTAWRIRQLGYAGPTFALTAVAMQGDMKRCLAAGCNDYLSKPIDVQRLIRVVHNLTTSLSEESTRP
ncbi:MAG: response regulator [Planctomycetaceae bacterium]|nr:response regulator [Planctomycetaceae bacterium]